jgi:hypothetical protein
MEVPPAVTYATRENARESIERGWLPELLPATARNIAERHDMDSNRVCSTFDLSPAESMDFQAALKARGFALARGAVEIPGHLRGRQECPYVVPAGEPERVLIKRSGEPYAKMMNFAFYPPPGSVYFWTY